MKSKEKELKNVFIEWGKNKQPSVSFEAIWQNANQKRSVRTFSHYMLLATAILLSLTILGSHGAFKWEQGSSTISESHKVMIKGSVYGLSTKIIVRGKSNLPDGAIIQATLSKDEESKTVVLEEMATVDKEGNFIFVIRRPVIEQDYILSVCFLPPLQPKPVQQIYGEFGERIEQGEETFRYRKNEITYMGVKLYDRIYGYTNTIKGQRTFLQHNLSPSFKRP